MEWVILGGILFWISFNVILPAIGFWMEKNRFRGVVRREDALRQIPVVTWKGYDESREVADARLVSANVVLCINWLQRAWAMLMKIFGGEIHTFSDLVKRGRREALVRMMESYPDADAFLNVRYETSMLFQGPMQQSKIFSLEVYVVGTAIKYKP